MHRLLLFALAVVAIEAHTFDRNLCIEEQEHILDQDPNADVPVCTVNGNYKNRQCDDDICWCVSKRRGLPIFNKQKVPLDHPYDCKRRPKSCLKKELAAYLNDPNPGWLPQCDCMGYYESKQCKAVTSDQCVKKRRKRQTGLICGSTPSTFTGFNPESRGELDTAQKWTMVSEKVFPSKGKITSFELYVGAKNRPLRIGIYRPAGGRCHFTLVQQIEFNSFQTGYVKKTLTGSDILDVQAGDSYGFTWLDKGVIQYDGSTISNYCDDKQTFNEGDHVNLHADKEGKREYSIRLKFEECKEDEADTSCSGASSTLGFQVKKRDQVDTSTIWTMVSKEAFTEAGTVDSFDIYVNTESARGLRVGIYRPTGSGECDFKLVQQKEFTGFKEGLNQVELTGSDVFQVQENDRYGFTWLQYGVIEYSEAPSEKNYCEKNASYSVGKTVYLNEQHGDRRYSIRMYFNACGRVVKTCDQCYCVDKIDGKEIPNTRTFDTDMECD